MNGARSGGWLMVLGLAVLSLQAGCGGGDERQPVFGKIIGAEGQNGSLSLVPTEGNAGPSAIALIVDGAYKFDASNGPAPGPHAAHILLEKGTSPAAAPDNPKVGIAPTSGENALGKQYSATVTVPAAAPFEMDINLNAGVSSGDRR